jgi:hypothetical protein|tara:strand:- start:292 stop:552 length:261 start_codon:yes stop_codon:yes gene_type:complete
MMNNKSEIAFLNHINRLQADINGRDNDTWSDGTPHNAKDAELNKVDRKNIASLREGRVPDYSDHINAILGNDQMPMREFSDLVNAS